MASVLGLSVLASSGANAVTISEFDGANAATKNKVVSLTLQELSEQTAKKSGKDTAICVARAFTTFNASSGETAPVGVNLISAQLKIQRDAGKSNEAHVEDIVAGVFDTILQDRCSGGRQTEK